MRWTGDWRKAVTGTVVLALHVLLVLAAAYYAFALPPSAPEKEIILSLLPQPKPEEAKKVPEHVVPSAPSSARVPQPFVVPKDWSQRWAPEDGTSLKGLGASLGCSAANYDSLTPEARAACKRGPWVNDSDKRETLSLILKAPHVMTHAERAERIRSTVDPCAAEKLTHQTDCIFKVIYGNDALP
ncbi:MAG TPA: hypothetical protein VGF56_15745 [Rhizomicrobium sp.]|jgi:hypothetical protein